VASDIEDAGVGVAVFSENVEGFEVFDHQYRRRNVYFKRRDFPYFQDSLKR
jgi:hypothetical protein